MWYNGYMIDKPYSDDNLVLIGISGFATSGKDTFAKIAQNILKDIPNTQCHILNLAADLKIIANEIVKPYLYIDCSTASPEDKKKIRKILVGIGQGFRDVDPFFWVKRVAQKIHSKLILEDVYSRFKTNGRESEHKTFIIVPDIRNINECDWIKSHKHGFVISITRDNINAPNDHEAENIPLIRGKFADFSVLWRDIQDTDENLLKNEELIGIVKETLGKIYETLRNS